MGLGTPPNSQQIHNEYYYFCHNEPHNDAPSVSVCQAPRVARQQPHGANLAPRRRATCTCPQPKRAAAPPPRAPAQPELMVGAAMWRCRAVARAVTSYAIRASGRHVHYCRRSHGVTCDVRISTSHVLPRRSVPGCAASPSAACRTRRREACRRSH